MPVSDNELEQAIVLIAHDLTATMGWDPRRAATFAQELASVSVNGWDAAWGNYAIKLAEDVQQHLHDTFVHTTWPACPLHPQHPLWLDGEHDRAVWRCTQAGMDIAPLGSLTSNTCASHRAATQDGRTEQPQALTSAMLGAEKATAFCSRAQVGSRSSPARSSARVIDG